MSDMCPQWGLSMEWVEGVKGPWARGGTVQYSVCSVYSVVQYSTVQYSTVQYSTVQYSTVCDLSTV